MDYDYMIKRELYLLMLKKLIIEDNDQIKEIFKGREVPFKDIAQVYKGIIKYEFLLEAKRKYYPTKYTYTLGEIKSLANYAQDNDFQKNIAYSIYILHKENKLKPNDIIKYIETIYGTKVIKNPAQFSKLFLKYNLINKELPTIYGYWQEYEDDYGKWRGRWRFTVKTIEWIKENLLNV